MSAIAVTGWGVLCPAGIGPAAFATGLAAGASDPPVRLLAEFDIRKLLGRKGTSTLDRCTGLAVVACTQALTDSGIKVDEHNRRRVGIALGTTMGSFKSTSEYSRETLVQERPYLVNPMLFPNTVMNRAAGHSAIWLGLKGVNATIAGGPLAFFSTMRYAGNAIRRGYADVMLAGAVEELTEHRTWAHDLVGTSGTAGEGAAVLVIERAEDARAAGRRADAEILSVVTAFVPRRDRLGTGLVACVSWALAQAGVDRDEVAVVVTAADDSDEILAEALADAFAGVDVERVSIATAFGDCLAADGALQAAATLSRHRDDPTHDGEIAVLVAYTPRGGVAAAVLRGWSRAGAGGR